MSKQQRWACGVCYTGTAYHGWQKQTNLSDTVEQTLTHALSRIADEPVVLTCAGRTDRGVHATGQVVHFDATKPREVKHWLQGGNKCLPNDISLQWVQAVNMDFHARYSARRRRYVYVLYNQTTNHPMLHQRVWWLRRPFRGGVENMQRAGQHWLGEHDFSSFRARDCQAHHPVRTLYDLRVERRGAFVLVHIEANAFLHHMVRNMIGVLIEIGQGVKPVTWAREVLLAKDRRVGGITAPADGLYLAQVDYVEPWSLQLPKMDDPWLKFLKEAK